MLENDVNIKFPFNNIKGTGELIQFNKEAFHFQELFEKKLCYEVEEWDQKLSNKTRSEIEEMCYSVIDTSEFKNIYENLIFTLNKFYGFKYIFQRRPSVRIQKPNDRAALFHIDSLTGHGDDLINFWVPLKRTVRENSLWLVNEELSKKFLSKIRKEKWTVGELDTNAKPHANPKIMKYGQILVFSNKTLHGCIDNDSDKIRVSFDFRALPINSSAGTKNKENMFYVPKKNNSLKNILTNANTVVYCNHKAKHISHEAQRAVILDFCNKNNFVVHREDSDWHGYDDTLPLITEWSKKYPNEVLVIFSRLCFDFSNNETMYCLKKANSIMNQGIFFALENEKLDL